MIEYIGDISSADASVLAAWAEQSFDILEFGMGASTQVIAHYTKCKVISIDTSPTWLQKTESNLNRLNIPRSKYELIQFNELYEIEHVMSSHDWDFVFDDGVDHMRRPFGTIVWPYIKKNGWLALHDQRRKHDWDNAAAIINRYWEEIGTVYYNHRDSNITFIEKREKPAIYSNWQIDENIDMSKW